MNQTASSNPRSVLFHRDYQAFQGGHLKMWNYFQHVEAAPGFTPEIYFTPETVWDATNPWLTRRREALPEWSPGLADVLFVGGMDWLMLPECWRRASRQPVLNLVQHVRHADPAQPLSQFLDHRAIRIAVSQEVTDTLAATGRVNGPVFTIPNGLDLPNGAPLAGEREIDVLIVGIKEPAFAEALAVGLRADFRNVRAITTPILRADFLSALSRSKIAAFLPHPREGFYLPALEAMALGALVVCPDCIGNRSFCRDGETCVLPEYSPAGLQLGVAQAAGLLSGVRERMLAAAAQVASSHSLAAERERFTKILTNLDEIWGSF